MPTAQNLWAWSITEIDNASADSTINWSEGQDPATVNNSARNMMAAIARQTDVQGGNVTVAGTANAITITTGQAIEAAHQALGFRICFKAIATNTGAATVDVDTRGAVAIKRPNGDALSAGDIINGAFHDIAFDGTNYKLLSSPAVVGTGTLAGDNTWSGGNYFHGDTYVGDATDGVVIKGTAVSPFMASLFSSSSAAALGAAVGLGPTNDVIFHSVGATGWLNTNQYLYGGVDVAVNPAFIRAMLNTLPFVGQAPGWIGGSAQTGHRLVALLPSGQWGYINLT